MITSMLIDFILTIAKILFNIVIVQIPVLDIGFKFADVLGIILTTTTQANNFIHFILGDTAVIIIPELLILITYKYVAYPIISFILSFTEVGRSG